MSELPWPERVNILSINPDAASRDDVARLASECAAKDREIAERFKKGDHIEVRGMLTQNRWTDKESGRERSRVEIVVFEAKGREEKKAPPPEDDPSCPF